MHAKIVIPLSIANQSILERLNFQDPEDGRCLPRDAKFVAIEEDGAFRFLREIEHADDCRDYYYFPGYENPILALHLSVDFTMQG